MSYDLLCLWGLLLSATIYLHFFGRLILCFLCQLIFA